MRRNKKKVIIACGNKNGRLLCDKLVFAYVKDRRVWRKLKHPGKHGTILGEAWT